MYKYGISSKRKLSEVHPDLQKIFNEAIKYVDISIICGERLEEDQDLAFSEGRSKVKFPNSKHNKKPGQTYVNAVDAINYPIDWKDRGRFYIFIGRILQIADEMYEEGLIENKIRSGGDWDRDTDTDDQTFHDLPHFEIV